MSCTLFHGSRWAFGHWREFRRGRCSFGWVGYGSVSSYDCRPHYSCCCGCCCSGTPFIDRRDDDDDDDATTWGPDDRNQPIASGLENDGHRPRWKMNLFQALWTDGRTSRPHAPAIQHLSYMPPVILLRVFLLCSLSTPNKVSSDVWWPDINNRYPETKSLRFIFVAKGDNGAKIMHAFICSVWSSTVVPSTSCTSAMHDITRKRICALLEKKKKKLTKFNVVLDGRTANSKQQMFWAMQTSDFCTWL